MSRLKFEAEDFPDAYDYGARTPHRGGEQVTDLEQIAEALYQALSDVC